MRQYLSLLLIAAVVIPMAGAAESRPAPKKLEIAPGVYVFMTAPYGAVGLDGNSIVVTSSDGVLVFDSNGTPAAAAAVLAEIRAMTQQPVRYVVHSHWHWDHWYGAQVYAKAFPGVKIVAHEKTAAMMAGPAIAFNKPGLDTQLPDYIRSIEKRIAAGETSAPPPSDLPALREALGDARFFLEQKNSVTHTLPTTTFKDRLDITLGERQIQILNFGRAVTPGDALMYLPKERILATGDLLVNPITYALSSYPSEWLRALEQVDALPVDVTVTGHGEPLRDKQLLHATIDVFRELLKQGKSAREKGLDVDPAVAAAMPSVQRQMVAITGDVPARNSAFRSQLVDWYMHRVYEELAGPLSDDIAPIPQHTPTPQSVVDELLAADRGFAAAAAKTTAVPALSAMFADDVVMPTPNADFARGKENAIAALNANPDNAQGRLEWTPIRGGVSADGQHGFTFGYMTLTRPGSTRIPVKYLSYWVKRGGVWRVAVYKRARAEQSPATRELMAPALPPQLIPPTTDAAVVAKHKASLEAAEKAFSDLAQRIGVGAAFVTNGSADAVNMGAPTQPMFTVGAARIGAAVGEGLPTDSAPFAWAADAGSLVASSGDLGVTFGFIRPHKPEPGRPAANPFVTVWRRAGPNDPWRYVAE
jgi:glyoxylase-like metal-dependent hydrolase (beta-lactamase superfamily II)/ketosteroid isomerase-like protein